VFHSSPESEHEEWDDDGLFSVPSAKIINQSLKELIQEFHLDEVHNLFTELDRTDAFEEADSFRRQVIVPVDNLHIDGITIPEIDIATFIAVSKATIAEQYHRSLTEQQAVGRLLCIHGVAWDDVRRFIVQRFAEHCSVTTKDALAFLAKRLGLHLLPDTLRKKIRGDHELWMIQGVPIEKKRLECDTTETRSYFEILNKNITGVPSAFVFNLDESGFQNWVDRR
jgi:hypothetical protein